MASGNVHVHSGWLNYGSGGELKLYVYYSTSTDYSTLKSTINCHMWFSVPTNWTIGPWSKNTDSYCGQTNLTFNGAIGSCGAGNYDVPNSYKSFTVNHNATTGAATARIYWKWGVNSAWGQTQNPSGYFDITLPTIPRYATPNQSLASKTETSITMNWSADATVDYIWYSKDNGSNWTGIDVDDGTSGSYTISGLTANTSYNIKTKVRRKDSQLSKETDATSISTYPYPYVAGFNNIKIGEGITFILYNPLGRSCTLTLLNSSGTATQGVITTNTSPQVGINMDTTYGNISSKLYESIPTSRSGTYKIKLVCSAVSRDTTTNGGTYSVKDDKTENPTFDASYIIDVVDTLHTAITGDNTKFIKGHNTLTGKIKPMVTKFSATPDYYSISSDGQETQTKTYSSSNISFSMNNITSNQIKVNAVDKRQLSTEAIKQITLIDYSVPTLTEGQIVRQGGIGDHIIVNFTGKYTSWQNLAQANGIQQFRYRYKEVGTSTWSNWITVTGVVNTSGTWKLVDKVLDSTFNNTKKYDMEIEVQDKLETVSFGGMIISTANAFIWKDLSNKYVGIGKKPTKTLDVAGDVEIDGALYVNGVKMIWYE